MSQVRITVKAKFKAAEVAIHVLPSFECTKINTLVYMAATERMARHILNRLHNAEIEAAKESTMLEKMEVTAEIFDEKTNSYSPFNKLIEA
jgi:hypothetical protein